MIGTSDSFRQPLTAFGQQYFAVQEQKESRRQNASQSRLSNPSGRTRVDAQRPSNCARKLNFGGGQSFFNPLLIKESLLKAKLTALPKAIEHQPFGSLKDTGYE
jgi:hypothetical protein